MNFITASGCMDDSCQFMHVEKSEVDKHKAAKKALAAKAKAKARSKSR